MWTVKGFKDITTRFWLFDEGRWGDPVFGVEHCDTRRLYATEADARLAAEVMTGNPKRAPWRFYAAPVE